MIKRSWYIFVPVVRSFVADEYKRMFQSRTSDERGSESECVCGRKISEQKVNSGNCYKTHFR